VKVLAAAVDVAAALLLMTTVHYSIAGGGCIVLLQLESILQETEGLLFILQPQQSFTSSGRTFMTSFNIQRETITIKNTTTNEYISMLFHFIPSLRE